jgi:ppGpp synthetase/RelA/SpoT-type nucleotidyltranferase
MARTQPPSTCRPCSALHLRDLPARRGRPSLLLSLYTARVPLPMAKNQVRKLGERLRKSDVPAAADLQLLYRLLEAYQESMELVADRLRVELGVRPSRRLKTTGTIIDKVKRSDCAHLANIQDLAGVRVVLETLDRREQDRVCRQVEEMFTADGTAPPRVIDRRVQPMHGYRAVHVVPLIDGVPVEIQVRTTLQHEWAELFEKMADVYGRGIRYGEQPLLPTVPSDAPAELQKIVDVERNVRGSGMRLALAVSDMFNLIERIPVEHREDVELDIPARLAGAQRCLVELGENLKVYMPNSDYMTRFGVFFR